MKVGRWTPFSAQDAVKLQGIIKDRWKQLHKPIHAAAYMLHPKFWDDDKALAQVELFEGTRQTIERLLSDHQLPEGSPQPAVLKAMVQLQQFR